MPDFKFGDSVWHPDYGFGMVLRDWPLCPCHCVNVMFDDETVEFILPADLKAA